MKTWIKYWTIAMLLLAIFALCQRMDTANERIAEMEKENVSQAHEMIMLNERVNALEDVPGCWDIAIPKP